MLDYAYGRTTSMMMNLSNMDQSMNTLEIPLPSFAYTSDSSEISAYDNPEITLPNAATTTITTNNHTTETEEDEVKAETIMAIEPTTTSFSSSVTKHSNDIKLRRKRIEEEEERDEQRTLIPEFDCPLARSFGVYKRWTYTIHLTLKELFHGKKFRFKVLRCKLNGKRKTVILDVDIPPGSYHGTQIIFKNAGNERKNGKSRQNIHFIVEEEKDDDDKFKRIGDDLIMDARLPWVERLKTNMGVVRVKGIDGIESEFEVDFMKDGDVTGVAEIFGAGMPIVGTEKRGKLVVRWEIFMPSTPTKWENLKRALHCL